MTTPDAPKLRSGSGGYERLTNAYQRSLVRTYDSWSVDTRRLMLQAVDQGVPQRQLGTILRGRMSNLSNSLITDGRRALPGAVNLGVGRKNARRNALMQRVIRDLINFHVQSVQSQLAPGIQTQLARNIGRERVINRASLQTLFANQRYRVSNYAGGAWSAIFTAQQAFGVALEQETGERIPVRWILHDLAVHCSESPGFFGCPDMAGEYDSFQSLLTVPAGIVTCRGNCRCRLETLVDGEWVRGL